MAYLLCYPSCTYVQDLNIAKSVTELPAKLDFVPGSLTITVTHNNWPKNVASEIYRNLPQIGMLHPLAFRSIRFIQQTAAMDFIVHSARKEIRIHFTSNFFANSFIKTLSEIENEDDDHIFVRVDGSKLGSIIGPKAAKTHRRMRTALELATFNFWVNTAYPKLTPDSLSPYITADIESYQTDDAAALLDIAKLVRLDMASCSAKIQTMLKVKNIVGVDALLEAYESQHYAEKYGQNADQMNIEAGSSRSVISAPINTEDTQEANRPWFRSQADDGEEPIPFSPKKKKSVFRRAIRKVGKVVSFGVQVFKRK